MDKTEKRIFLCLFRFEMFNTRKEAGEKEKYFKSGIGKNFLKIYPYYFEVVAPERVWEFEPAYRQAGLLCRTPETRTSYGFHI